MAKGFNDTNGAAKKGGEYYKWIDGDQTIRLVGDIVPRYVYWKKTAEGKNMSVECLAFDRDLEKFTNIEKDWFQAAFPEQKCSWAYVARGLVKDDQGNYKAILIPMKKKLYQSIQEAAKDLGDPTNTVTGWDAIINRAKTGSQAFNVEYTLKALKCKVRELSDEEKEVVAEMPPIDEQVPRQTPAEQKEFIDKMFLGGTSTTENTETDEEAINELDDDAPF